MSNRFNPLARPAAIIVVGQEIYHQQDRLSGVVVHIHSDELTRPGDSPEPVNITFDVVWENGSKTLGIPEETLRTYQIEEGSVATPDMVAKALRYADTTAATPPSKAPKAPKAKATAKPTTAPAPAPKAPSHPISHLLRQQLNGVPDGTLKYLATSIGLTLPPAELREAVLIHAAGRPPVTDWRAAWSAYSIEHAPKPKEAPAEPPAVEPTAEPAPAVPPAEQAPVTAPPAAGELQAAAAWANTGLPPAEAAEAVAASEQAARIAATDTDVQASEPPTEVAAGPGAPPPGLGWLRRLKALNLEAEPTPAPAATPPPVMPVTPPAPPAAVTPPTVRPDELVTIYIGGPFGPTMHVGHHLEHGRHQFAQYPDAPFVRFIPKGKRKTRSQSIGFKPYLLILRGIGHPNPEDPLVAVASDSRGVIVSRTRYASTDSRYDTEFNAIINDHLLDHPDSLIADYRYTQEASIPHVQE